MKKQISRTMFPMQMTMRFYLWTILLVTVPMILLSAVIWVGSLQSEKEHQGKRLYYLTEKLDGALYGSYEDLLVRRGSEKVDPETQIKLLSSELQPIVDSYTTFHPNICLGYYSSDLQKIIAAGPDINLLALNSSMQEKHEIELFSSNRPELSYKRVSSLWNRDPVLVQIYPLYRNGRLTGYTFASMKMADIYNELWERIKEIFLVGFVIFGLSIFVSWKLFHRLRAGLSEFAQAIVGNSDQNRVVKFIPELSPILDTIKDKTEEMLEANFRLQNMITVKEGTEKALRQSEERFSKAFAASPSIMCIVDDENEQFIDVNLSFFQQTGYTREDLNEHTWREIIHWTDPNIIKELELQIAQNDRIKNFEVGFFSQSGVPHFGLMSIESIMLHDRKCLLVVVTDITEHKVFEKEMVRLDRLNLIGQMAAGISHEIRNPMTTVRGFLQVLGSKENCKQYQEYYQLMIDELDRANSIITEFLSIGRNKIDEQKEQNLNEIIRSLAPLIEADALGQEKNLKLELGSMPDLFLNEKEIRQVILNLSRNGLEAMEKGGQLWIKTYSTLEEGILGVRDSGPGMGLELIQKLGTPFFTTKDAGTGLGLAVCYGIATRHKARISVESGEWGTEFLIHFPLLRKVG